SPGGVGESLMEIVLTNFGRQMGTGRSQRVHKRERQALAFKGNKVGASRALPIRGTIPNSMATPNGRLGMSIPCPRTVQTSYGSKEIDTPIAVGKGRMKLLSYLLGTIPCPSGQNSRRMEYMPRPSVTWSGILCLVVPMGICNAVHAVEAGDTCATAGVLEENGTYYFDTTGASGDDPCGVNIPTVWYKFTAPEDGFLGMYLCGSTFDTFLSVFSGISCPESCSGVVQGSEDFCGAQSAVRISVTVGMTYYFAVSGSRPSDFGPGIMRFSYAPARPGLTCADAVPVTRNGSYPFTTHGAPPSDPCFSFQTVWYRFVAPLAGTVTADLCGST